MVILNISQMGFLVDMWIKLISWISNAVPNYAWAIVILTIGIKLIMLPLDFFNKKVSRKNSQMQSVIQPQLEKAKAQYGHDQALYNQKMNEIYKSNNYNVVGSCLFMIVNLVLTFTIFITLLNGMNQMASIRITQQYSELQETYNQTIIANNDKTEEEQITLANGAVVVKYNEVKDSWLWIQNIWKADTTTNSIPTFDEFIKVAQEIEFDGQMYKTNSLSKDLSQEDYDAVKAEYENIMQPLRSEVGRNNGYYILVILVVLTSVLSQWLSMRKLKPTTKNAGDPAQSTNKMMMILMPVLFGVFALSSTSMFSIYLVVSQIVTIAFTPLIDFLIEIGKDKEKKVKATNKNTPSYSRENVKGVFEPKEATSQPKEAKSQPKKKTKEKKNDWDNRNR